MTSNECKNLAVLGAANHLISEIVLNVIGSDVATEVDGVRVTQSSVRVLAQATLNKALSEKCHA